MEEAKPPRWQDGFITLRRGVADVAAVTCSKALGNDFGVGALRRWPSPICVTLQAASALDLRPTRRNSDLLPAMRIDGVVSCGGEPNLRLAEIPTKTRKQRLARLSRYPLKRLNTRWKLLFRCTGEQDTAEQARKRAES